MVLTLVLTCFKCDQFWWSARFKIEWDSAPGKLRATILILIGFIVQWESGGKCDLSIQTNSGVGGGLKNSFLVGHYLEKKYLRGIYI